MIHGPELRDHCRNFMCENNSRWREPVQKLMMLLQALIQNLIFSCLSNHLWFYPQQRCAIGHFTMKGGHWIRLPLFGWSCFCLGGCLKDGRVRFGKNLENFGQTFAISKHCWVGLEKLDEIWALAKTRKYWIMYLLWIISLRSDMIMLPLRNYLFFSLVNAIIHDFLFH